MGCSWSRGATPCPPAFTWTPAGPAPCFWRVPSLCVLCALRRFDVRAVTLCAAAIAVEPRERQDVDIPVGYLISVLLLVAPIAMALAPLRGSWTLRQISWRLGMQVSELPFLVAVWLLGWTAFAGLEGDLASPGGLVGLGIAILELAALLLLFRRSMSARPAIAEALRTGLERGRRPLPAPELVTRVRQSPSARSLLMPLAVRRRDVVRVGNLAYGSARPEQLLDLYRSRSNRNGGPCLVYFHGGGYYTGRKNREARALVYRLASEGWLWVSANYRLPPSSRYPASLIDVKAVIAWVREHAGDYGGDPRTVFLAGSSAGAHLAAIAALTANDPSLQPGFESTDTSVDGAICLYGFYDTPSWIDIEPGAPSSALEQVHSSAPPLFVAHGELHSVVPVADVRRSVSQLAATSPTPVVYAELPGAQHTFDLYNSIRFESVIDGIEAFTASVQLRRPDGDARRDCDLAPQPHKRKTG